MGEYDPVQVQRVRDAFRDVLKQLSEEGIHPVITTTEALALSIEGFFASPYEKVKADWLEAVSQLYDAIEKAWRAGKLEQMQ